MLKNSKEKRIMIVGQGAIGSEIIEQLSRAGYQHIGVLTSKYMDVQSDGIASYNIEEPIRAIADFQPDLIIDTSSTECTQKILTSLLEADGVGQFKYFAITPNKATTSARSTQEDVIAPNLGRFQEKGIEVERRDGTNSLFSRMFEDVARILKTSSFKDIIVADSHRAEKEFFTQGGIATLEDNIEWSRVSRMTIKTNGGQAPQTAEKEFCHESASQIKEFFLKSVEELRKRQTRLASAGRRLAGATIELAMQEGKTVTLTSDRTIPNREFETKTGYRSKNSATITYPEGACRTMTANIGRKEIASGIIVQTLC